MGERERGGREREVGEREKERKGERVLDTSEEKVLFDMDS